MSLADVKSVYVKNLKFMHPFFWLSVSFIVSLEIGYFFLYANKNLYMFPAIVLLLLLLIAVNWTFKVTVPARADGNKKSWKIYGGIIEKYSDLFIIGGFMISPLTDIFLGYFGLISWLIVTFTRLYGNVENLDAQQGPMGKYARWLLIALTALVQLIGFKCGHIYMIFDLENARVYSWMDLGAVLLIILAQITIFRRIFAMRKAVNEDSSAQW